MSGLRSNDLEPRTLPGHEFQGSSQCGWRHLFHGLRDRRDCLGGHATDGQKEIQLGFFALREDIRSSHHYSQRHNAFLSHAAALGAALCQAADTDALSVYSLVRTSVSLQGFEDVARGHAEGS